MPHNQMLSSSQVVCPAYFGRYQGCCNQASQWGVLEWSERASPSDAECLESMGILTIINPLNVGAELKTYYLHQTGYVTPTLIDKGSNVNKQRFAQGNLIEKI